MRFIETFASYVPSLILDKLIQESSNIAHYPFRQKYETVCVFCDISGYTALSEQMANSGKGAEGLARNLNSYFAQMVRLVAADGGDVFKFAGDAMIVLWPETDDTNQTLVRRAAQCACAIQEFLNAATMEDGVTLSVKIGIGVGKVSVLHIGGVNQRVEYLAVGAPLVQAFASEHHAVAGQVVCSPEAWQCLEGQFDAENITDGFVRLDLKSKPKLVRKQNKLNRLGNDVLDDPILQEKIKSYVVESVVSILNPDSPEDEFWGNEVRRCSVMFLNLGITEQQLVESATYDEAMMDIQSVITCAQRIVQKYEGSINKFLMDDKGSTLIVCFGLPPDSHENDPARAVLASLQICEQLFDLGYTASVGITTGEVFCGVVGSKTRREYSVLGDNVNLSARLMQKSIKDCGGILCDWETKMACDGSLSFSSKDEIMVKGKSVPITVFSPYPSDLNVQQHLISGRNASRFNIFKPLHVQQLQNYSVYRALATMQPFFNRSIAPQRNNNLIGIANSHAQNSPLSGTRPISAGMVPQSRRSIRGSLRSGSTDSQPSLQQITRRQWAGGVKGSVNEIMVSVPPDLRLGTVCDMSSCLPLISFAELENFEQLQERIVAMAKSAHLVPASDMSRPVASFCLAIQGTRTFVPYSKYSIKYLHSFVLEAKRNLPGEESVGECIVDLVLVRISEKLNAQSRFGLARRRLLENKIRLVEQRKGGVILIEGDAGVGKSHLLCGFISKTLPHAAAIFSTSAPAFSSKSYGVWSVIFQQYLDTKALSMSSSATRTDALCAELQGDVDLIKDAVLVNDLLGTNLRSVFSIDDDSAKKSTNQKKRGSHSASSVDSDGIQLQKTTANEFDSSQSDSNDTPDTKCRRFCVMFHLLNRLASRPHVIAIDDSHFMDDDSWSLILAATNGRITLKDDESSPSNNAPKYQLPHETLPILIVLCGRPMESSGKLNRVIPLSYFRLRESSSALVLKLDGLPQEEIAELIVQRIGVNVVNVSDQMFKLIELKCLGNPSSVIDLLWLLQRSNPPSIVCEEIRNSNESTDEGMDPSFPYICEMSASLIEGFRFENCPLPPKIDKKLSSKLDRLTTCQVLVLKTAALIGQQFQYAALLNAYPIEGYKQIIPRELEKLEDMGLIVRLQSSAAAVSSSSIEVRIVAKQRNAISDTTTFQFMHSFLVDCLIRKTLKAHNNTISERIERYRNQLEVEQRKIFIEKSKGQLRDAQTYLKAGFLDIQKRATSSFFKFRRKTEGGEWKSRYCILQGASLQMFYEDPSVLSADEPASCIVDLHGSTVEVEPQTAYDKKFVFRLVVSKWSKDNVDYEETRPFVIASVTLEDMNSWLYMIRYCIESLREAARNKEKQSQEAEGNAETDNIQDETLHIAASLRESGESSDLKLVVRIAEARDLINGNVYGLSSPFVACQVDNVILKTANTTFVSLNPCWSENMVFNVSARQWAKSVISLSIWSREMFITSDFLGHFSLPLNEIAVQSWTELVEFQEFSWHTLQKRKANEQVFGELSIAVCLVLSEGLTAQHSAGKSLDSLKTAALEAPLFGNDLALLPPIRDPVIIGRPSFVDLKSGMHTLLSSVSLPASSCDVVVHVADASSQWVSSTPRFLVGESLPAASVTETISSSISKSLFSRSKRKAKQTSNLTDSAVKLPKPGEVSPLAVEPPALKPSLTVTTNSAIAASVSKPIALPPVVSPPTNHSKLPDDLKNKTKVKIDVVSVGDSASLVGSTNMGSDNLSNALDLLGELIANDLFSSNSSEVMQVSLSRDNLMNSVIKNKEILTKKYGDMAVRRRSSAKSDSGISQFDDDSFEGTAIGSAVEFALDDRMPDDDLSVLDQSSDIAHEYYYQDSTSGVQGPFSVRQIVTWYDEGYLHEQVLVQHGKVKPLVPLGTLVTAIKRVSSNTYDNWEKIRVFTNRLSNRLNIDIADWDFDIFLLQKHDLFAFSAAMLANCCNGLHLKFNLNVARLREFMQEVERMMTQSKNHFHNYFHVLDVCQTCFVFLTTFGMSSVFSELECFSLLISAITHDLGHTGLSNSYHVNSQTPLAVRFNDQSVLENYHIAMTLRLLRRESGNILDTSSLSSNEKKQFRKLIILEILATDMTYHFSLKEDWDRLILKEARTRTDNAIQGNGSGLKPANLLSNIVWSEKLKELMLKSILHMSDISNPAKTWRLAKLWSDRVTDEFFAQGDREATEGLPISLNMDRNTVQQAAMSINFLDFVVSPYLLAMTAVIPGLRRACNNMNKNRLKWDNLNAADINTKYGEDEDKIEEEYSKWMKRKLDFDSAISGWLSE